MTIGALPVTQSLYSGHNDGVEYLETSRRRRRRRRRVLGDVEASSTHNEDVVEASRWAKKWRRRRVLSTSSRRRLGHFQSPSHCILGTVIGRRMGNEVQSILPFRNFEF